MSKVSNKENWDQKSYKSTRIIFKTWLKTVKLALTPLRLLAGHLLSTHNKANLPIFITRKIKKWRIRTFKF